MGSEVSLYQFMRQSVKQFIENKYVAQLILSLTIFLCVVIFSELSFPEALNDENLELTQLGWIYYYINYFLLTFFVIEIILKLFALGHLFLMEFINVFDSIVVIISFGFLVLNLKVKFMALLRILRLIKVMTEMKKVADANKAKQEAIKKQKKQSSNMASYVERVLDFFERQAKNDQLSKVMVEDIQWAIDVISANKLYTGNMHSIHFNIEKPEIKAWVEKISLKSMPVNIAEMERLKYYEETHKPENQKKSAKKNEKLRKKENQKAADQKFNPEETQKGLLQKPARGQNNNSMLAKSTKDDKFGNAETDINTQFINLAGDLMNDFGPDHLDQAIENFDTI